MATLTKTWDFTTGTLGWSFTAAGVETGSQNATNGLVTVLHGKNLTANENFASLQGWHITDTIANLFGIGTGDTVSQLGDTANTDGYDWLCLTRTTPGVTTQVGPFGMNTPTNNSMSSATTFSSTTSVATKFNTAHPTVSLTGTSSIDLVLAVNIQTGNSASADVSVGFRKLVLTVTYTPSAAAAMLVHPFQPIPFVS